jgi:hypothetical protein
MAPNFNTAEEASAYYREFWGAQARAEFDKRLEEEHQRTTTLEAEPNRRMAEIDARISTGSANY